MTPSTATNTGKLDNNTGIVYIGYMTTQKRAVVGGEIGPNGEWYDGGKFIATKADTVKRAPACVERSADDAARMALDAVKSARIAAWLAARQDGFRALVARLTANPGMGQAEWERRLELGHAGFMASLGRQLWECGSLSRRQADAVCRFQFGRLTNRNSDAWEAMLADLTERCPD